MQCAHWVMRVTQGRGLEDAPEDLLAVWPAAPGCHPAPPRPQHSRAGRTRRWPPARMAPVGGAPRCS